MPRSYDVCQIRREEICEIFSQKEEELNLNSLHSTSKFKRCSYKSRVTTFAEIVSRATKINVFWLLRFTKLHSLTVTRTNKREATLNMVESVLEDF